MSKLSNRVRGVAFMAYAFLRAAGPLVATSSSAAVSTDLAFEIRGFAASSAVTFEERGTLGSSR